VVRARAEAAVATRGKDDVGVLTFPIPGTYRDQVPLTWIEAGQDTSERVF
jgi:hypothetical protein